MNLMRWADWRVLLMLLALSVLSCLAELRFVMSVFRHGDRYPISVDRLKIIYPKFPYENLNWFPDSPAGLTKRGKLRAFELGEDFRVRYGLWLGPKYSKDLVDLYSSHLDRCFKSSLLLAAGLFIPRNAQTFDWQSIDVWRPKHKDDTLFWGAIDCRTYIDALEKTISTNPAIVAYDKQMQPFYDRVSRYTGGAINNTILNFLDIELAPLKENGILLPSWANSPYILKQISEAAINEYIIASYTKELQMWTGGLWIRQWLNHVDDRLAADNDVFRKYNYAGKVEKKAAFYGGHDRNIAGILNTLGIFYRHVPSYSSAVIFELHGDHSGRYYVKVIYKDKKDFNEVIVPGCGTCLCPLDTFRTIFESVTPSNSSLNCGGHLYP